jgi:hypothetical protein
MLGNSLHGVRVEMEMKMYKIWQLVVTCGIGWLLHSNF